MLTSMSRRFQNVLAAVIVLGIPCLALIVDACFSFPFTKGSLANAIDFVKDRVLAPIGLP